MPSLSQIIIAIESITEWIGRTVSWLVLALVLLSFIVAVPRYVLSSETFLQWQLFSLDWEYVRQIYGQYVNALSDSIQYVHAAIFMLGVSYALKHRDHVRIDILYRNFSPKTQAWVNILGCFLLLYPTFAFLIYMSWDYVLNAWSIGESSARTGGLGYLFVLKSLLVIMPMLMILQGTALLLQQVQVLRSKTLQQSNVN
jgi:TRAP-type mannitol/chloroaromatic compound transport system permease small subunit